MRSPVARLTATLRAAGCVRPQAEARILLGAARDPNHLDELLERRVRGAPLEHVVGWAAFCGLRIQVTDGVFIPRRRSEALAEVATGFARPGAVVVDLCCGSGAIGLVLARAVPGVHLVAADVDERAVACALRNLEPLTETEVHRGDLWSALPPALAGRVDVAIANAPYVPTGDIALMPRDWREHEPLAALDGGPDGLGPHRRLLADAGRWLASGGVLLVEVSRAQAVPLSLLATDAGLDSRVERRRDGAAVVSVTPRTTTSSSTASSGSSSGR